MPEPIGWRKMVGPSIILAGLSLGSGEFILWPFIVHKPGFVFFWACMLGVVTQFFLNMEIERWTLVTGESAITGFCRLSRHWSWMFLTAEHHALGVARLGDRCGTMLSWLTFGPVRGSQERRPTFGRNSRLLVRPSAGCCWRQSC